MINPKNLFSDQNRAYVNPQTKEATGSNSKPQMEFLAKLHLSVETNFSQTSCASRFKPTSKFNWETTSSSLLLFKMARIHSIPLLDILMSQQKAQKKQSAKNTAKAKSYCIVSSFYCVETNLHALTHLRAIPIY